MEFGVPLFDYTLANAGQLGFGVDGRTKIITEACKRASGVPSFYYTLATAGQLGFGVDGRTATNN